MADDDGAPQYWYNLNTKQVEVGPQSPAAFRAGPFTSSEEAANAPELFRKRNEEADADDIITTDPPD